MAARYQILVCDGPSCGVAHESVRLKARLEQVLGGRPDLAARVSVCDFTCFGRCDDGPNLFVRTLADGEDPQAEPDYDVLETERGFYPGNDEESVIRILLTHCGEDRIVEDLVDEY